MRLIDKDALVDRLTRLLEANREWKPEYAEFCEEMICMVEDTPFWEESDFAPVKVSVALYDQEEIHHNCTVQILSNSVTGDVSIGWWPEDRNPYGSE